MTFLRTSEAKRHDFVDRYTTEQQEGALYWYYYDSRSVTTLTNDSGGVADEVTEEILRAAFVPFGEVLEVMIPMDYQNSTHFLCFVCSVLSTCFQRRTEGLDL